MAAYVEQQCIGQVDQASGAKYWTCGVCHKSLSQKWDLIRHIESFHIETNPYHCVYCDTRVEFKTKRGLQRHTNANHK